MIAVGILKSIFDYQREELQLLLFARGCVISTGEISKLSEEFLLRFYVLHKRRMSKMKVLFDKKGGMVLHLDGTGESGDEIVFTAKEGRTGITIDSQTMRSESRKYIEPFLQIQKDSLGNPLVGVRDMSKRIRDAFSKVFPGVPQQICHYHFVCNLGKLVFKERYSTFRKMVINSKIPSQIRKQRDELVSTSTSSKNMLLRAESTWVALAIEYLLWPRHQPSGFPFTLPYFEVMNRILEVKSMAKKIVHWNVTHNLLVDEVINFLGEIEKLTERADVKMHYLQIKKIWNWFEEVRKVLRVSRHLSKNGQKSEPSNAKDIKMELEKVLNKIKVEGKELDKELKSVAEKIVRNCELHLEELIVEVKDSFGKIVNIVRDNNIEERAHRWSRMHVRRRTGRGRTTNEMAKYGALLAVLSNIENDVYVKEVMNDINDFVREMQDVTKEEIEEAKKLIKADSHKVIVKSDTKRIEFLKEFIEVLEHSENENDAAIERWLSKFN